MKENGKRLFCILGLLLVLLLLPVRAMAQEEEDGGEQYQQQLEDSGANELMEQLPESTQELMERYGIDAITPSKMLSLKPGDFFSLLFDLLKLEVRKPIVTLLTILGVLILAALVKEFSSALSRGQLGTVFYCVCVLVISASVVAPIVSLISDVAATIAGYCTFLLGFIPVFISVISVAGHPVAGATYNLFLFGAAQVVSSIASRTLVPLLGVYLALCMVSGLAPTLHLKDAAKGVKSVVTWTLGLATTLFTGLLSMQSFVAASADTVSIRATKFVLGTFVPVVGSSLSEAYASVKSCLSLLKTSVGAFAVIGVIFTFLPILIQVLTWWATMGVSSFAAKLLGMDQIGDVLDAISYTLGILLAIILCFAVMIIVCTTMMMSMGISM